MLVLAAPFAVCLALIVILATSQRVTDRNYRRALEWAAHAATVQTLQATADSYVDAVERRVVDPTASTASARAALADANRNALALAASFAAAERAEEADVALAIDELIARGEAVGPASLEPLRAYYRGVVARIGARIDEERLGSRAAAASGERIGRRVLIAAVAACALVLLLGLAVSLLVVRASARTAARAEQALDGEVAHRTHELAETNRQLEAANRELAASDQRHRVLFDLSPIPIGVYDGETFRFVAANESALQLYGYTRDEILSTHVTAIAPPDPAKILPAPGQVVHHGVATHRRKDGSTVEVDTFAHGITFDGRPSVLAMAVDVSDNRRLEEHLRRAQKLEAIGQLAGGVAHDFNNILMVILANAALAADELPADHPQQVELREIVTAGERASELTRQLLAFGRKQTWQPAPLSLNTVACSVQRMLARLIGEDIELLTRLDPALGTTTADAGQLEQALTNLVVNARDAMAGGGRITIATRNLDLDDAEATAQGVPAGRQVALSVHDEGTGMDAATRARIFEPFFTTKEVGKGSGLGLAMVFGIVQQCEGRITVESTPGQGSTFTMYLPRTDAPTAVVPVPTVTRRAVGTETILVVEDDAAVRRSTTRLIGAQGYRVLEASDGAAALALLDRHGAGVDLVLSDVVMPRMDGRALALALADRHPGVKVLLMSGYARPDPGAPALPPIPILPKPFTVATLDRALRDALAKAPRGEA